MNYLLIKLVTALMFLGLFIGVARADEYLKCSKQVINPYKGKPMSAGAGSIWLKKSGDKVSESSEFEMLKEEFSKITTLKK